MTATTSGSLDEKIEIIRSFYEGLNRADFDFVSKLLDVDISRNEFEGSPFSGHYHGQASVLSHLINGRSTWDDGTCQPIDFFLRENKIVVPVQVKVRIVNLTEWIDEQITDGFVFKDGLIAEFHSFATMDKASEWAGVE